MRPEVDVAGNVAADAEARKAADDTARCVTFGRSVRAVLEWEWVAGFIERSSLQRSGRDQTVLGVVVRLGVVDDVILGRTIIQHVAIHQRALREPVATAREADAVRPRAHTLFVVVLDASHDMQAAVEKLLPAAT